jgi:alkanesulfonate monooxygenase SsuD/methylene tetrahydromethanopterin reductase-like flavin-dependent oxidoreductase (luciferase family)
MEFGMFHEFPSMPGRGETEMFDEAMAQVDAAERWGLDVMWLAEIHFARGRVKTPDLKLRVASSSRFRRSEN